MKKSTKTPLAAAVGTAFVSTFAATAANAEANPFEMTELSNGYMQLSEADKGKSEEMKCGAKVGKKEGSCGEGQCGNMMKEVKTEEGKCAGNKAKAGEKPAEMSMDKK